jgi:riboflavin kinase/FMN adenylyltransferase
MTDLVTYRPGGSQLGPCVMALGVFDGVHVGHQALVRDTVADAGARGVPSCVLTFDRDPDQVVTPGCAAPQLTSLDDKLAFLAALGPSALLVVPFDEALAHLSPARFVTDVMLDAARPVRCVVGRDFRFGARAAGDVTGLRALGRRHGFDVFAHRLLVRDGSPVSSSRIRSLLAEGQVQKAAALLGRPHRLTGTVVRGAALGHTLGTPTANLESDPCLAHPAAGVYAGFARVRAERWPAAISVGIPPSFPTARSALEAHLIGFEGDLYGEVLTLEFVARLREQRAFDDRAELARAITADVRRAAALLGT